MRNTSAGVEIELDGPAPALEAFAAALRLEAPPLARIDRIESLPQAAAGFTAFAILDSHDQPGAFQPISPDVGLCDDCLRELFDPADRRYRYPFINCTNCGPRFTIITDIPYDRPNTTMAGFPHVPGVRRRVRRPARPALPCPADRLPGLRAADLAGDAAASRAGGVSRRWPKRAGCCGTAGSWPSRGWAASTWPATPPTTGQWPSCAGASCASTRPSP